MKPFIHTSKTSDDLADAFAMQFIEWVTDSVGGPFHLALSGGRTPSLLFSLLADRYRDELPWQKIHFWWGDERMVAPEDPESNFGVVNELLFSKIGLISDQIHRIKGEVNPASEVQRYGMEIYSKVPVQNEWPLFDLIMLGLGDDGHTASIFPNQMQLLESNAITGIASHPDTGQLRITLTGKVLNSAKRVAFLVSGVSKSRIFHEIIHKSPHALTYPASYIHPSGELHWFVDKACMGK